METMTIYNDSHNWVRQRSDYLVLAETPEILLSKTCQEISQKQKNGHCSLNFLLKRASMASVIFLQVYSVWLIYQKFTVQNIKIWLSI